MKLVVREGPGQVGLNYMWLPCWIGMNANLVKQIEAELGPKLEGRPLDDDTLDWASGQVIELLQEKFNIEGLDDYLDGIKFVTERYEGRTDSSQAGEVVG